MLVDSDQLIQCINSSYLATLLLKLRWHTRIYEETFHVNSIQLKKRKIFEFLWLESRVYKKQQLWPLSGRYQTLIWRPGDTVQNLESLGLSERVDSTEFRIRSTKRSYSESVMAQKLHTSQIFKGRAYELKCHMCIWILFE